MVEEYFGEVLEAYEILGVRMMGQYKRGAAAIKSYGEG